MTTANQFADISSAREAIPWLQVAVESGCWRWQRAHNAYGYGVKNIGNRTVRFVHRLVYEALVGPIPEGLTIDHLCRVRDCCNPAHLEAVPMGVNRRRAEPFSKDNFVCRNGHRRTDENTRWTKGVGGRPLKVCKDCRRAANERYVANPAVRAHRSDYARERYASRKASA